MGLIGDVAGQIIGGIAGIGQGFVQRKTDQINARTNFDQNMKMSQYQSSKDLEMWNMANQYNSPSSQMARYTSAGLNPNLIYGTGTASAGNTATTLPKYQAPTYQQNYKPLLNMTDILSQYQDYRLRQAQIDNVKQDTVNKASVAALNAIAATYKPMLSEADWYNKKEIGLQNQVKTDTMLEYYQKQKGAELTRTQADVVGKIIDNAINQIELNWAKPNQWINAGSKIMGSFGIANIGRKLAGAPKYYKK